MRRLLPLCLLTAFLAGCVPSTISPTVTAATAALTATTTPNPSPTSSTPQVPGLVKTSLELYRNGKTYEIVIGYAFGEAFFNATPRPAFPEKVGKAPARSAELKWYGDLDRDGETEFIVSVMSLGAYASEEIRVYKYNAASDEYYVADSFSADYPAVKEYDDFNHDGNPELVAGQFGFCYECSPYTNVWSALTILRFENGKFTDVTTEYPALLESDSEHFVKDARNNNQGQGDAFITLASYYYDMYRLGQIDAARPIVDRICRKVVVPNMNGKFDCEKYLADVEAQMRVFKAFP